MGYEEYKEKLVKTLDELIEKQLGRIKQRTIRIRSDTRAKAVEAKAKAIDFFRKLLNMPEQAIEAEEVESQYSPVEIALVENVQYARKWNVDGKWFYILGSRAERDMMRGSNICPGRAAYRG